MFGVLVGRGVYEYYMDEAIFQSMLSLETFWNYIQIYIENNEQVSFVSVINIIIRRSSDSRSTLTQTFCRQ